MLTTKSFRLLLVLSLLGMFLSAPLGVQAQTTTGSISGLIRDANNQPIYINLPIVISNLDGTFIDSVCKDTSDYSFTGLPLDSYIVEVGGNGVTCNSDYDYAREYWPNAPFPNSASPVELTASNPSRSDIDFSLDPGGMIAGLVVDTNLNVIDGRVSITLNIEDYSFPTELYTCTDSQGYYSIKHVPLGFNYKVAAGVFPCPNNADSFATINAWPNSPTNSGGTILTPTTSNPDLEFVDFILPYIGETPAGDDILTFTSNGFVTFDSVSTAGTTSVELIEINPPPTPTNFQTVGEYYDVSTSAAFTSAQVCFNYDDTGLTLAEEAEIRLFHRESLVWVDVTDAGYPATSDNVVCGTVTNFSPFVVARPGFKFSGFFQPVDNLPTLNLVKAGTAIPVKFSLDGDHGLAIFADGYPKSQWVACDSTASVDGIEETVAMGSSSLSYAAGADQYRYIWKTDKTWANTCRQLVIKLNDGTYHRANFKFK